MRLVPVVPLLLVAACSGGSPTGSRSPAPVPSPVSSPSASPSPSPASGAEDPLSPRPAPESPAPVGQPACRAGALTLTDADSVVNGSTWREVFVVRTKGVPCQLRGWPTVRVEGAAGPPAVRYERTGRPVAVTLSSTTTVSFFLTTGRSGACSDAVRVVAGLPGTAGDLTASTTMRVCGPTVQVSPVLRNTDSEG